MCPQVTSYLPNAMKTNISSVVESNMQKQQSLSFRVIQTTSVLTLLPLYCKWGQTSIHRVGFQHVLKDYFNKCPQASLFTPVNEYFTIRESSCKGVPVLCVCRVTSSYGWLRDAACGCQDQWLDKPLQWHCWHFGCRSCLVLGSWGSLNASINPVWSFWLCCVSELTSLHLEWWKIKVSWIPRSTGARGNPMQALF